ncbi:MAG TPA: helix-turn-helix transcriptional regulator [Puia sp.]|jgi:transcriptional regulator with XRE-family HTH domain
MNSKREAQVIKNFGKNLEKIRKEKNLSLRDLAHLADVDHSSIQRIEKGVSNPKLTMIITLAEALEIPLADLLIY